jgi:HSP20 family protein
MHSASTIDRALENRREPRHRGKRKEREGWKEEEVRLMLMTFPSLDELIRRFDTDLADLVGRTDTVSPEPERRLLPAMEVRRTGSEYVVRMELPGVDPDSMDVTVEGPILRVRAERRSAIEEEGEELRREIVHGTFEREVVLPSQIDPEKLSARYEEGILEVRIPNAGRRAVKVPVDLASGEKPALEAAGSEQQKND